MSDKTPTDSTAGRASPTRFRRRATLAAPPQALDQGDRRPNPGPGIGALGAAAAVGLVLLSVGCGDAREDVRIGFCKRLVMTRVAAPDALEWTRVTTKPRSHEGLDVILAFRETTAAEARVTREAICHYRYDAREDTALTLADPLSAYATSPEGMRIDGTAVPRPELARAVGKAMLMRNPTGR